MASRRPHRLVSQFVIKKMTYTEPAVTDFQIENQWSNNRYFQIVALQNIFMCNPYDSSLTKPNSTFFFAKDINL